MRWIMGCLLLTVVACSAGKKAYKKDITQRMETFFIANQEKDYEQMADMLYFKLFETTDREQMLAAFDQLKKDMDYGMYDMVIDTIGEAITYQDTQYVMVQYHYQMTMRFHDEMYHDPQMEEQLLQSFKQQYEEVTVDNSHTFTMPINARLITIAPKGSKEWTLLEVKQGQEGLWLQFLPEPVIEKLAFSAAPQPAE